MQCDRHSTQDGLRASIFPLTHSSGVVIHFKVDHATPGLELGLAEGCRLAVVSLEQFLHVR